MLACGGLLFTSTSAASPEFNFDFDPCPYPKPDEFDGLTNEWGKSNYVNPPFGSIIHEGKKKGATALVRKALEEYKKGEEIRGKDVGVSIRQGTDGTGYFINSGNRASRILHRMRG